MTLQQMQYIVAVDKYRHFVRAAESCGITQSTLSSMIQKLEDELDIIIFDRKAHPVEPTEIGIRVIKQARAILSQADSIKDMILTEQQQECGEVKIGVIPTVAPYIIPKMFSILREKHDKLQLYASESQTKILIQKLERSEIDIAIMATPIEHDEMLEIPLYYEKFLVYVSPNDPLSSITYIESDKMPTERLWLLQEGHCLRNQVLNICSKESSYSTFYEAGSIETLVRIVDANGGYTIIPELHLDFLSPAQLQNIRRIINPEPVREISLVIRKDYIKERFLNVIAKSIQEIIPAQMIDPHLRKFSIRL